MTSGTVDQPTVTEGTGEVRKSRDHLVEQAKRAASLGHTLTIERRDPPEHVQGGNVKFWGVCSCGYRSRARATHAVALWAAFAHVGDVLGEVDAAALAAKNGVSVPGSRRLAL